MGEIIDFDRVKVLWDVLGEDFQNPQWVRVMVRYLWDGELREIQRNRGRASIVGENYSRVLIVWRDFRGNLEMQDKTVVNIPVGEIISLVFHFEDERGNPSLVSWVSTWDGHYQRIESPG